MRERERVSHLGNFNAMTNLFKLDLKQLLQTLKQIEQEEHYLSLRATRRIQVSGTDHP